MAIERWDPFREAISLRDAMNSLVQESFIRPGSLLGSNGVGMLPLDICETEDAYVIRASLPGVKPDSVAVDFERGELTVKARREPLRRQGACLVEEFDDCPAPFRFFRFFVTLHAPAPASRRAGGKEQAACGTGHCGTG